jgi:hypothetical protein
MMQPRSKLAILILVLESLVCLWIWRSQSGSKITLSLTPAWCATAAGTSALPGAVCHLRKRVILVGVVAAAIVANTLNIVYELSRDPTSHNLFPLELAMTSVINLFAALRGIAVVSALWQRQS